MQEAVTTSTAREPRSAGAEGVLSDGVQGRQLQQLTTVINHSHPPYNAQSTHPNLFPSDSEEVWDTCHEGKCSMALELRGENTALNIYKNN